MVLINEWLPNPAGNDAVGEWIELYNDGSETVDLTGWYLTNSRGKTFTLDGYRITGGGYLVVDRSASKLTLRNTDETLSLRTPSHIRVSVSKFVSRAPEGRSVGYLTGAEGGGAQYLFTTPTPGVPNAMPHTAFVTEHLPSSPALTHPPFFSIVALAMVSALVIAGFVLYIMIYTDGLSHTFFGRDGGLRV